MMHNDDNDVKVYTGLDSLAGNNKDNLRGKISMTLLNMPNDVSDLAKVRYIYKTLGSMFCYDYGIINNEYIAGRKVNYEDIDKFQTCTQIAEILSHELLSVNDNIKTRTIPRKLENGKSHLFDHLATEVIMHDNKTNEDYKLLLDLTLDLFRIQAGMQTKQFAFTTDASGSYDIISLRECEALDKEIDLIDEKGYLDIYIDQIKHELINSNLTIIDKLKYIKSKLSRNFSGPHEARLYYESIIRSCIPNAYLRVFNMYYKNVSRTDFESLFIISTEKDEDIYLLVDNNMGMIRTDLDAITSMKNQGWETTSGTLKKLLDDNTPNEEIRTMKI